MERVRDKLTIGIEANTNQLQRKLRAIAKHAEALADELKAIDDSKCPECGGTEIECATFYKEDEVHYERCRCLTCGTWEGSQ